MKPSVENQLSGQEEANRAKQEEFSAQEAELKRRAKDLAEAEKKLARAKAELVHQRKIQDAKDEVIADREKALEACEEARNNRELIIEQVEEREQAFIRQIKAMEAMTAKVIQKHKDEKITRDNAEAELKSREAAISQQELVITKKHKFLQEKEQALVERTESLAKEAAKFTTKAPKSSPLDLDALAEGALIMCTPTQAFSEGSTLSTEAVDQIKSILYQSHGFSEPHAETHAKKLTELLRFRVQFANMKKSTGDDSEGPVQLILTTFSNEVLGNGLFANHIRWADIDLVGQLHDQMLRAPNLEMLYKLEARAIAAEKYFNSLRDGRVPLSTDEFMDYIKQCGEYAKALQEMRGFIGEGTPVKKALISFMMSVCQDLGKTIQFAGARMGFAG
ncbi:hypothetical protein T440DRAFT_451790 [Plenodomus tracheiphilus IPT5]|uniref:Uncharacterized protein n=1 Tax=Plenodomus tracheiphilus IPT5 TaxID=1408161 RepID=A0A6A7B3C2_9PLEO|nr:hypothetical protein T440DRAFT_451790 [Plenodomus tracheiphilus IPT5]